ncbi:MAG: hypothetical protein ABSG76_09080 [Xanthobacteraceae bacterium]
MATRRQVVPIHWKIAGTLCRSAFLIIIMLVTAHISLPGSMSSAVFTHLAAADFIRAAIGIAVCVFLLVQLFRRPQDEHGYKAWTLIGLALAAVAVFIVAVRGGFLDLA